MTTKDEEYIVEKADIYRVIRANQNKSPKKILALVKEQLSYSDISDEKIGEILLELAEN